MEFDADDIQGATQWMADYWHNRLDPDLNATMKGGEFEGKMTVLPADSDLWVEWDSEDDLIADAESVREDDTVESDA